MDTDLSAESMVHKGSITGQVHWPQQDQPG